MTQSTQPTSSSNDFCFKGISVKYDGTAWFIPSVPHNITISRESFSVFALKGMQTEKLGISGMSIFAYRPVDFIVLLSLSII